MGADSLSRSITRTHGSDTREQQFAYDAAGNTTALGDTTVQYDETGKATSVTSAGKVQSNVYDADGTLLLQRDPDDSATLFLGDTESRRPSVGAVSATRTYSIADIILSERTSKNGTSTVYALDTDVNANADIETDVLTGAVTRRRLPGCFHCTSTRCSALGYRARGLGHGEETADLSVVHASDNL